jgi:hypothetical protein
MLHSIQNDQANSLVEREDPTRTYRCAGNRYSSPISAILAISHIRGKNEGQQSKIDLDLEQYERQQTK